MGLCKLWGYEICMCSDIMTLFKSLFYINKRANVVNLD